MSLSIEHNRKSLVERLKQKNWKSLDKIYGRAIEYFQQSASQLKLKKPYHHSKQIDDILLQAPLRWFEEKRIQVKAPYESRMAISALYIICNAYFEDLDANLVAELVGYTNNQGLAHGLQKLFSNHLRNEDNSIGHSYLYLRRQFRIYAMRRIIESNPSLKIKKIMQCVGYSNYNTLYRDFVKYSEENKLTDDKDQDPRSFKRWAKEKRAA